jgi:hypothetical protein
MWDEGGDALSEARRPMDPNEDHIEISTDQVRQGETGHGVRYVLFFGTLFAVVALGLAVMFTL